MSSFDTTTKDLPQFKEYRLAGVQIASLDQQQLAQQQIRDDFASAIADGHMDTHKLGNQVFPVVPVYEDQQGNRFLGTPAPVGPQMQAFENTFAFDHERNPEAGGFFSAKDHNLLPSGATDPYGFTAHTSQAALQMLAHNAGGNNASLVESFLKSSALGLGQQILGQSLTNLASRGAVGSSFEQFVASAGTLDGLKNIGESLASGLISNALSMGIQAAMSGWKVDDNSSTAEHVAHEAVQAIIGQLQGELMNVINQELSKAFGTLAKGQLGNTVGSGQSMTDKINEFFAGPTSTANVPVGNIGSTDTNDGFEITGAPTVLVNGMQASRVGETVTMTNPTPDAGPLLSGNPTVITLGQRTSGKGHVAVGTSKGIVTLLDVCSTNVLMGPKGMPDVTPTPKKTQTNAESGGPQTTEGENQGPVCENPKKSPLTNAQKKMVDAAIEKIKSSDFGQSPEGQKVVKALENGKFNTVPSCARGNAHYDPSDNSINLEPDNFGNKENLERILVHEGTHAVDASDFPGSGNSIDNETRAFENMLRYYAEQLKNGAPHSPVMDEWAKAYMNAKTRDDFGAYMKEKYPESYKNDSADRYDNPTLDRSKPPRTSNYPDTMEGTQQYLKDLEAWENSEKQRIQNLKDKASAFEKQRQSEFHSNQRFIKQGMETPKADYGIDHF